MHCKHCGESDYRKDGWTRGVQRYFCKCCGRRFTESDRRTSYRDQQRLMVLTLYKEGVGFRGIERITGVSHVTAMRWIRELGREIKQQVLRSLPEDLPHMDMVVIDEMWHYTQKNKTSCGYGLLCLTSRDGCSPSKWALVVPNHSSDSGQGSKR